MASYPINYFGSHELLTHPLYTKWSSHTIGTAKAGLVDLQTDLDGIMVIFDNLEIIAYLSSIVRAIQLTT